MLAFLFKLDEWSQKADGRSSEERMRRVKAHKLGFVKMIGLPIAGQLQVNDRDETKKSKGNII